MEQDINTTHPEIHTKSYVVSDKGGKLKFPPTIPKPRTNSTYHFIVLFMIVFLLVTWYLNDFNTIRSFEGISYGILMSWMMEILYRFLLSIEEFRNHFKQRYRSRIENIWPFFATYKSFCVPIFFIIIVSYFYMDHGLIDSEELNTFSFLSIGLFVYLLGKLIALADPLENSFGISGNEEKIITFRSEKVEEFVKSNKCEEISDSCPYKHEETVDKANEELLRVKIENYKYILNMENSNLKALLEERQSKIDLLIEIKELLQGNIELIGSCNEAHKSTEVKKINNFTDEIEQPGPTGIVHINRVRIPKNVSHEQTTVITNRNNKDADYECSKVKTKRKKWNRKPITKLFNDEESMSMNNGNSMKDANRRRCWHSSSIKKGKKEVPPIYNSLRFEEDDGLNYSSAMAHSFYHGYLRLILPKTGGEDKNLTEIIEVYSARHKVSVFPKLFILVPKSGVCPVSLEGKNIEESSSLDEKQLTIAGVQKRSYKNSVYKIREPNKKFGKPHYVCVEYATPLRTFTKALEASGKYNENFRKHKDDIILHFYLITRELIRNDPEICDLCELICYDDRFEKRTIDVSNMLLQKINKKKQPKKSR